MENKLITTNEIADTLINLSAHTGICDERTAIGLKSSQKKNILKSSKEGSFSDFTNEIKKRQTKKNWED
ncbi:MAG: hypothetical protein NC184_02765 [Roseburia sp.]|nr:hypothetical protein [Roseburia sp.]